METTYIYALSILALLIVIGLKLRKAGKDIENKNLTQAGTLWLIVNGTAISIVLVLLLTSWLKGSDICNCSDISLAYDKEIKAAKGDQKKTETINKKYKGDLDDCENLLKDKYQNESAFKKELEKCPSYKKRVLLEEAEVCNCSDILLEMTEKAEAAKGDEMKLEALENKYKKDMETCQKLFTDTEKFKDQATIEKELEKCASYKKLKKMNPSN
jgi:hypothetical protein